MNRLHQIMTGSSACPTLKVPNCHHCVKTAPAAILRHQMAA